MFPAPTSRAWGRGAALAIALLLAGGAAPAVAQAPPPGSETPPRVAELLDLLTDPTVRDWLDRRAAAAPAPAVPEVRPDGSVIGYAGSRVAAIRAHLAALGAALPRAPGELARAGDIAREGMLERGVLRAVALLLFFALLGRGGEWLFARMTATPRRRLGAVRTASVAGRLRAIAARFAFGLADLAVLAGGSIGAFLAFEWPPLLGKTVLGFLLAFVATRVATLVGQTLLAPGTDAADEAVRIVPMRARAARFWYVRLSLFAGWFAFGKTVVELLGEFGVSPDVRRLVAHALGLGLLALAIEIAWRRPDRIDGGRLSPEGSRLGRRTAATLLSLYFVLLWVLWVASAIPGLWLAIIAFALPAAIAITRRALEHVLRQPGRPDDGAATEWRVAFIQRGARAALILVAALLLARAWNIDLVALAVHDSMATRLLRGAIAAVIIILVADLAWHVVSALIERQLDEAGRPSAAEGEEARRRARLRTLLPILRNMLLITLIVMASLMALAAMGVEIAPLVAGAGVVGVAVGFGSQTIIKDIMSGVFFMLDDAFRVGEYIQTGNYKGTVESFSLRSVKLRHHRGPLYTVPFGNLGAVQNMSRDWVIDKLIVGVTYDSDLEKAKTLVKQIGRELAQDPEFGPHILQPLKMQGVEEFGDFAVQLRMKMTTKPDDMRFAIRRKANALIKRAFDANGIKFAFPTVQVAGGSESTGAAAQRALELVHPAVP